MHSKLPLVTNSDNVYTVVLYLHRQVEWMELSDAEFLSTGWALSLFGNGSAYARAAKDVATGGYDHLRASPFKRESILHANRTFDEVFGRTFWLCVWFIFS